METTVKNCIFYSHLIAIALIFKKSIKMQEAKTFLMSLSEKIKDNYRVYDDLKSSTNLSLVRISISNNTIRRNNDFTKDFINYFYSFCKNENTRNDIINHVFEFFKINPTKKYILNKKDFKICICGSMTYAKEMLSIRARLNNLGYLVTVPKFTQKHAKLNTKESQEKSKKNKIEHDFIKDYHEIIKNSDAILVLNFDKDQIKNYIGPNSFLEMGFAHVLNKRIYLINNLPEVDYTKEIKIMSPDEIIEISCVAEIITMKPIILNGNLLSML